MSITVSQALTLGIALIDAASKAHTEGRELLTPQEWAELESGRAEVSTSNQSRLDALSEGGGESD